MDPDDLKPKPLPGPAIGEDLSNLSVADLEHRITLLRREITRVEAELTTKRARQEAANAIFKS